MASNVYVYYLYSCVLITGVRLCVCVCVCVCVCKYMHECAFMHL